MFTSKNIMNERSGMMTPCMAATKILSIPSCPIWVCFYAPVDCPIQVCARWQRRFTHIIHLIHLAPRQHLRQFSAAIHKGSVPEHPVALLDTRGRNQPAIVHQRLGVPRVGLLIASGRPTLNPMAGRAGRSCPRLSGWTGRACPLCRINAA